MSTLEKTTSELAARGAVFEVLNGTPDCQLVGELSWLDAHHVFWFVAHGDRENDGHVLEFDRAEVLDPHRVQFYQGATRIGRLTDIASSCVEDPEDYTVAFALWQQVAPRTQGLIRRSRERFEMGEITAPVPAGRVSIQERDGSKEIRQ